MTDKSVDEILEDFQKVVWDCGDGKICFCEEKRAEAKTQLRELVKGCQLSGEQMFKIIAMEKCKYPEALHDDSFITMKELCEGIRKVESETTKAIESIFNK